MNYHALYENKRRGTFDFPIELYHVNQASPRYQMPLHWHLEYELIYILQGEFRLSLDGRPWAMGAGDCAWIGDGVVHGGVPANCVYQCVVFDLGTLLHDTPVCAQSAARFLADETGCAGVFSRGGAQARLAGQLLRAIEQERPGYEWTTLGLMWQLMGSLVEASARPPGPAPGRKQILRLKNVLTYIRDQYKAPVTLEELAAVAGMAPKYFCRAFAQMTGKTPIAYLNYYRIEQASERLAFTQDPVTEIALGCGFNDVSHFSRTFSRYKGMPPTVYRKSQGARP